MIKKITVINHRNEEMAIDLMRPEESGFVVDTIDGISPGKATINTTEITSNDGALANSSRIPSRNIILSLVFLDGKNTIEELRHITYRFFQLKKTITLIVQTDTRVAEISGIVESNSPNIFSKNEGTDISIICPNPFFYSSENNVTIFYGTESAFEFPFMNDSLSQDMLVIGNIKNQTEQVVTYEGDAEVGVTITIHAIGVATNITIYNTGTRELMKIDTTKIQSLTGYGIISGDDIVISTVKGNKSITLIRAGQKINILNCLSKDANWFQLAQGDNIFAYVAETGSSNLQFRIENRILFEGV